jgi:hypothetical protein
VIRLRREVGDPCDCKAEPWKFPCRRIGSDGKAEVSM